MSEHHEHAKTPARRLTRRSVLTTGTAVLAGTGLSGWAGQVPAVAAGKGRTVKATRPPTPTDEHPTPKNTPVSANGWATEAKANDGGTIWSRAVNGSNLSVEVRTGEVAAVLLYVARRFHYEIDALRTGDVVGFRKLGSTSLSSPQSNLASGTAISIRSGWYPEGTSGGFFAPQLAVIRDILAECGGVVRWGGDDKRPDEALFSIDVPPGSEKLSTVGSRILGWNQMPGQGAGQLPDPLEPTRRSGALALQRAQRAS
jgi:hypothetical protein